MDKRQFIKNCLTGLGTIIYITPSNTLLSQSNNSIKLKEAMYYSHNNQAIICELCPNECIIYPNKSGTCRTRKNIGGKLYSLAYSNPIAIQIDPIEKKPLFHYLPESNTFSFSTAGCNFICLNCLNWQLSQSAPQENPDKTFPPDKIISACQANNCQAIAYTYTEPTTYYEYMIDTAAMAKIAGIKNLLISNGYINKKPLIELSKYIDAANIDLKSFSDRIYSELNGGKLQPILDSLKIIKEKNIWLEITNLVIPKWTDDLEMIKKMCKWLYKNGFYDTPLHFSRFFPMYKLTHLPETKIQTLEKARNIALDEGIKYVYIGNISDSIYENTYCHNCNELLIERIGFKTKSINLINGKCNKCSQIIPGVWN